MADHLVSQVYGGQLRSFEDRLSEAGMTGDMLKAVLQDPRRARVMVEALMRDLASAAVSDAPSIPPHTVITFEIAGRQYEAVSFLNPSETSVNGDTMVARTEGENGGGLGEDEGLFLWEHRSEWPAELKRYYLVCTKWRVPGPRDVRCFDWDDGGWYQDWLSLDGRWDGTRLVLRRRM